MYERGAVGNRRGQRSVQLVRVQPQIDELEVRVGGEVGRNVAGECVRRKVNVPEGCRKVGGDFAGEEVVSDIEDLEVREVENRRGESPGERVVVQVKSAKESALGERGRYGAVELAEVTEGGEVVSEAAAEVETRQAELVNTVVVTDDATPVAGGRWRGRIPAVESAERVVEVKLKGR
ncbi:unnamed protein product [Prunus armeniaca]|uniref:Uncharacterized protein n=1 Tax=Prunus armeniaca TaxID=36596 RepID=A0A6J5W8K1_PRUAR|nr:unnamed protein product [Prunus armeniaca]CAB4296215.1 unnamed protein product [Prunus armeniaca]